jgi:hypothetical protein
MRFVVKVTSVNNARRTKLRMLALINCGARVDVSDVLAGATMLSRVDGIYRLVHIAERAPIIEVYAFTSLVNPAETVIKDRVRLLVLLPRCLVPHQESDMYQVNQPCDMKRRRLLRRIIMLQADVRSCKQQ